MRRHREDGASVSALAPVSLGLRLPPEVRVVALSLAAPERTLELFSGKEALEVPSHAAPKRRAEFLAGRHAATLALERLGQRATVGRNQDGTPAWPSGVTGSISHGGGVACAAVASKDHYRSLGIDVERILLERERSEVARLVARTDELLLLKAALPHASPSERLTVLFSCKESLYKCLFPLTGAFMEFEDAHVVGLGRRAPEVGVVTLRLERSLSSEFPAGATLHADFHLGKERVESAVCLRSSQSQAA